MFKRTLMTTLGVLLSHSAFAASDADIGQTCIAGMKTANANGGEITFRPDGSLEGEVKSGTDTVKVTGSWQVQGGTLAFRSQGSNGQINSGFIPVRLDDAGTCYMTINGLEQVIHK